jgi:diguanylate cyclase (GGDEF)-like protein
VLLPFVAFGYFALRLLPGVAAYVLAQGLLLVTLALAALASAAAFSMGPVGQERRAWGVASAAAAIVMLSHAYRTWQHIGLAASGQASPSAFDAFNLLAAVVALYGILSLSAVRLLPTAEKVRLSFDVVAFLAVTFIAVHQLVMRPLAPAAPWYEPVQRTTYSLFGALVILATIWMLVRSHAGTERAVVRLLAAALVVFGAGMFLWPLWTTEVATRLPQWGSALVGAVYLVAGYLALLAALTRVRRAGEPWRTLTPRRIRHRGTWTPTLLSLSVLAGTAAAGWLLYSNSSSEDAPVLLSCGVVATLALVARTAASAVEMAHARSAAGIDPVTGALGCTSFVERCDEALTQAERSGRPFSIVVFDIDAFSRVNAALGHAGGDAILAWIAEAVIEFVEGRGELFRLNADEFAVTFAGAEREAAGMAAEILAVIRGLSIEEGRQLSASFGVAGVPSSDGYDREALVGRARAAEAWAKFHGKGRVVRFDERIVRALGVEGRLRANSGDPGLNMVRAISSAADARDPRNYYHSRNVAALCTMFSEALGLEPDRVRRVEIAALLHDCGRLGLPESLIADVLRTSRQQLAAREHSTIGERIAQSVGMPDVPMWVRHHHERWDGAGYPDGLEGEGVPLESRIIALADAYDAMTTGTRNRPPVSRGAALQEIDLGMGSRFDPMLAERFIEVVGETASLGWSDEWEIR